MNRLSGKVALITGGGRGIGRAIALRFASEGAAVMLAATKREPLEATAQEVRKAGGRAATTVADVADEAVVKQMIAATLAELGRLDILVNNAGIGGPTLRVVDMDRADWDRTLAGELGEHGITVNAIAPGAVRGERVEGVIAARAAALGRPADEVERELFVEPTALKRMVGPDDVAATAAFLSSDDAANITGETISVSAGFRA